MWPYTMPEAGRNLPILYGQAVGDALGAGTESQSPEAMAREHGSITGYVSGSPFGYEPGEFTDDTQMLLAVLGGYRDAWLSGGDLLTAVSRRFVEWLASGPQAVGNLTRQALGRARTEGLAAGFHAWAAGGHATAGNGGLMRAAASVVAGVRGPDLYRDALLISALTHADPRSLGACVVLVRALESLTEGAEPAAAWAAGIITWEALPVAPLLGERFGREWAQAVVPRLPQARAAIRQAVARGVGRGARQTERLCAGCPAGGGLRQPGPQLPGRHPAHRRPGE